MRRLAILLLIASGCVLRDPVQACTGNDECPLPYVCCGGGLALALAESAVFSAGGTLGVELSIEPQLAPAAWLFSESASRILVSAPLEMVPPVLDEAVRMGVPAAVIGTVRSDTFSWPGHFNVSLHDIIDRYERGLIFNTNS